MTTIPVTPGLVASDRCDRCGAQAYVRTSHVGGFELLWCAHHYRQHEDAIAADPSAAVVSDELSTLAATPDRGETE